jgi:Fe-S oxidoreductase
MALKDFEHDMQRCTRCSFCKWVPFENFGEDDFIKGCPSAARYHFHAYAAGGKFNMAYSLLNDKIDYTGFFQDALYKCMMDGCCDVACKAVQDIEPLQCMQEMRLRAVQEGKGHPAHTAVVEGLRKNNNMLMAKKVGRGKWAQGLSAKDLSKEKAKVVFHAGCRYSYDEPLQATARRGLALLLDLGIDVGIFGKDEICCAGRAYQMGYGDALDQFADRQAAKFEKAGVRILVTPCADCYQAFKVLYDKVGKQLDLEVLHITEYIHRLIRENRIRFKNTVPLTVTYHDPCHLGRLAEPWVHWEGEEIKVLNQMICHDPPKKFRRGADGIYDIPREILRKIPGVNLVEMSRIRESAWCCGAGGGVKEAYPDFATWTATERLREARSTGAKALVTACGWCRRNFMDAIKEGEEPIDVYDIIELVQKATELRGSKWH